MTCRFKPFIALLIASNLIVVCLYQDKVDKLTESIEQRDSVNVINKLDNDSLKEILKDYWLVNKSDLKTLKRVNVH